MPAARPLLSAAPLLALLLSICGATVIVGPDASTDAVIARDPARVAAVQRARAALEDAAAARLLPPPKVAAQVWNVP